MYLKKFIKASYSCKKSPLTLNVICIFKIFSVCKLRKPFYIYQYLKIFNIILSQKELRFEANKTIY